MIAALRRFFSYARRKLTRDPYAYVRHDIFRRVPREDERCYVCGRKLRKGVTQVGSGERMHSKCWPKFLSKKIASLKERGKSP